MRKSVLSLALAALAVSSTVAAAAYPDKTITLVHGFGAGGNADTVARVVAAELQKRLGQTVVVESRTGAGGAIASSYVAKAAPDGYTLVMLTGAHTASAAMQKNLPYDPVNDFATVSTVTAFPFVVAISADSPVKSLDELISRARAKPDSVTFSSVGIGSTQHLTGELLASAANARMLHVPYRGGGAPALSVIAGDVDVLVDTATVAGPHIQSGKLRALGVTSSQPWAPLPGVPTVSQALPGFEVMSWLGVAAPAGTPQDVIDKLNGTLAEIAQDPAVQPTLEKLGSVPTHSTPQAMREMIARDIERWKTVVTQANIPLQ